MTEWKSSLKNKHFKVDWPFEILLQNHYSLENQPQDSLEFPFNPDNLKQTSHKPWTFTTSASLFTCFSRLFMVYCWQLVKSANLANSLDYLMWSISPAPKIYRKHPTTSHKTGKNRGKSTQTRPKLSEMTESYKFPSTDFITFYLHNSQSTWESTFIRF